MKKFSSDENTGESSVADEIKVLSDRLVYVSETDSPVELFAGVHASEVTVDELTKQLAIEKNNVEQISLNDFFLRLTTVKDWFREEQKEAAARWAKLRDLLETNLRSVSVFRIGKIQIDIYVVGLDGSSNLTGIKTKAVET